MKESQHESVCQRTDRKEEKVRLKNMRTGEMGWSVGCTTEGGTIQVVLDNGELDSWDSKECEEG